MRSINQKINSRMPLSELLLAIMDVAREMIRSEGSSLLLYDKATGDLIFDVVISDKGDVIRGERVPKGKGIAGSVAETMRPVIVDEAEKDPRWYHDIDRKYNFHTRNILCVPMIVMGELVGVLEVVNSIERERYDDWDLEQLLYIADHAAIAIHNRRLYDDLSNRIEEMTALYEVAQAISLANPDDRVIDTICASVAHSMKVKRASIIIYDEEDQKLKIESAIGLPESIRHGDVVPLESTVAGHIFTSGDPMLVSDVRKQIPQALIAEGRDYLTDSFLAVPIIFKNKNIGVLALTDKADGSIFTSFDLRVVTTISSQISQLYANIIAHKEAERQRRLAQEIDIAAELQRKILRGFPSSFKNHRMAVISRPAKVVGGDFYDFYQLDRNKYSVLIADVSGKGIPAALFMGTARNVMRAERRINSSPAALLRNANKYIYEDSDTGMFVTLFYAVVDSHNNIITYASAGHNNQIFFRSRTKELVTLKTQGRALGISPDLQFEERVIMYEKGDLLVLFTDGVLECFGGDRMDIDYGEKSLGDIILSHADAPLDGIIRIFSELFDNRTTDTELVDDITLVMVQF